jgi:alpha-tubulin suppressor-like RCC1 family protein
MQRLRHSSGFSPRARSGFLRVLRALCTLALLVGAPHALAQPYTQISAGENHTCALLDSGAVHCWGLNLRGQLGNGMSGTGQEQPEPVRVMGIQNTAAHIAAGREHNCAALKDGQVYCWGYNFRGQLGNGNTVTQSAPVPVSGVANAIAVAAGGDHSCALISGGSIKCWGYNGDGELGAGSTAFTSLTPLDVVGITNATAITAGLLHTCALLANNRVRCWGYNNNGALGDGTFTNRNAPVEISGFVSTSIDAGSNHTCSTYSGSVYCWGDNSNGILGDGTTTDRNTPVQSQGVNAATAVAAGELHTCIRSSANFGQIRCWGYSGGGRLGNGDSAGTTVFSPVTVLAIDSLIAVTAGRLHTCGLTSAGSAKCWGSNVLAQVGSGRFGTGDVHTVPQFVAPRCELDIDGDGTINASTDGVLAARALAGMSGAAVTSNALGAGATRTTWPQIRKFLETACGVAGLAP